MVRLLTAQACQQGISPQKAVDLERRVQHVRATMSRVTSHCLSSLRAAQRVEMEKCV